MVISLKIRKTKSGICATVYLNGFYTEISCADLEELFEILSKHDITKEEIE